MKKRVLQIITDNNIGGAGLCLIEFLKCFNREKFDISVALPRGSLLGPRIIEVGISIEEVDDIKDTSFSIPGIFNLLSVMKKIKPEIVHTHSSLSGKIAAKMLRLKVINTRHCDFVPEKNQFLLSSKILNRFLNNITTDLTITVSEIFRTNLIKKGIEPKKIQTIFNGIEGFRKLSEAKCLEIKEKHNIKIDEKVVAIVARLDPIKCHFTFIKAAELILKEYTKVKFLIVGTGPMLQKIEDCIKKKNLSHNIKILGFISNIEEIMNIIDVIVCCSSSEGTSLSLLEAMSVGKPLVVPEINGILDMVKNKVNGLVVPQGDISKIKDAILCLLNDKSLYNKISANCVKIYKKKFRSEIMAKKIEEIYESV